MSGYIPTWLAMPYLLSPPVLTPRKFGLLMYKCSHDARCSSSCP